MFVSLRSGAAQLIVVAALACGPVGAQQAAPVDPARAEPSSTLDPASPMQAMPDIGVDWPDLSAPDAPPAGATGQAQSAATTDTSAEEHYDVALEGVSGLGADQLHARFDALSALVQNKNKNANVAQINRRARDDADLLQELLRAYGYYDASVETRIDPAGPGRVTVTLTADPGQIYRFATVDLPGLEGAGAKADAIRTAFGIKPEDPVSADKVTAGAVNLKVALGKQGFAFATVDEPKVTIDHDTHSATLSMAVHPGGSQRFGQIRIEGKKLFDARHLSRIARFHPGDPYDASKLDDFRRALIQTTLVSAVQLTPQPGSQPGTTDIAVKLEPAPKRTIAAEAGYGTGEGARLEVSWQHRNLIKPEGAVTFRGVAGTREQSLGATLRRSNYKARDRVLTAQIVASHSKLDAYDAKTFTVGVGLERQTNIIWQKKWTWSIGTEFLASDERDQDISTGLPQRRTFLIAAVPTTLSYDGSDDLLNPSRGFRLAARLSPEASLQNGAFGYAKLQLDASGYLPVGKRVVFAGRVRAGSIMGASRDRIAPSRRFYSGGGGSVRGYGYQDIGPRDVNNDPVGGRSLAEFGVEARVRFGNFGVVPFLDGGNLYTQTLPRFTGLRYGAGMGVRYYTSFGPIRVDVGTPVNPQKGDARVTVYVSLGQAF
ncbi:autotransporter assembly complex protein TamA [Flavisphingomonas formosensis]|uniref:autotransporter assembly complex protein TamA n=1 Tax=Flavisphingomonas formosensis TaxID=861534 RepID=UPI0012F8CF5B|nr:BamA/TamA family outer membrane protein [Sphingomonas formosensis]